MPSRAAAPPSAAAAGGRRSRKTRSARDAIASGPLRLVERGVGALEERLEILASGPGTCYADADRDGHHQRRRSKCPARMRGSPGAPQGRRRRALRGEAVRTQSRRELTASYESAARQRLLRWAARLRERASFARDPCGRSGGAFAPARTSTQPRTLRARAGRSYPPSSVSTIRSLQCRSAISFTAPQRAAKPSLVTAIPASGSS